MWRMTLELGEINQGECRTAVVEKEREQSAQKTQRRQKRRKSLIWKNSDANHKDLTNCQRNISKSQIPNTHGL